MSEKYLALLRGINVGGNNIIKMVDLKSSFESMGFTDIVTYIQSGNVIFNSESSDKIKLVNQIESKLSKDFGYESKIALVSFDEMKSIIENAPNEFGSKPEEFKYDVIFIKEPFISKDAIKIVSVRDGVDKVYEGNNVLYFSRLITKQGQSYLKKIISHPVYKNMTVRNWNTSSKLFNLMCKSKP